MSLALTGPDPVGAKRKTSGLVLLALALAFNAVFLAPELRIGRVTLNDATFHLAASERLGESVARHEPFLDPWVSEWSLGYPVWRSYQPLPHLVAAAFLGLTRPFLGHAASFAALQYLLLVLLPASAYLAARIFGLGSLGGGVAALLVLAPSGAGEFGGYGLSYGAFVWRGSGLYTQLFAMHFLLFSLAVAARALDTGRRRTMSAVLLAATALSHIVFGYVAFVSAALFALLGPARRRKARLVRLITIVALALLLLAWFVVPMLLSKGEINHSRWEPGFKWDSFGASRVLGALVSGELLDAGRFPFLTLLLLGAVAAAARSLRDPRGLRLSALSLLWLALFFGRPAWDGALRFFGLVSDFPLHRLQAAFEVSAVLLIAWSAERWLSPGGRFRRAAVPIAAAALVIAGGGILADRARYLRDNTSWGRANLASYDRERSDIDGALSAVRGILAHRPGRVSAGKAADWGNRFKVGFVPFYNFLAREHLDEVSFLYHAMSRTSDVMVLRDEGNPAHEAAFGVRAVVAPSDWKAPAFFRPRGLFGRFAVYEASPEGYFGLADLGARAAGDAESEYQVSSEWLGSEWPSEGLVAAIGGGPVAVPFLAPGAPFPAAASALLSPRGTILRESKQGETYRAEVDVLRPCIAVLKITGDPGLVASVDGRRVEAFRVTPGFLALPLPGGRHTIEVRYRPGPLRFLLFLGGIVLAAAGSRRLARSSAGPEEGDMEPEEQRTAPPAPEAARPARSRPAAARVAAAIFVGFFGLYLAFTRGHFQSSDEITVYQTTQSLWEKGDLSASPHLPNVKPGVGGKSYGVYSSGQSIAALPLYGAGKLAERILTASGLAGVRAALAGPPIQRGPDYRWGGEVTIFFVGLFNALATALLCAVFFAFNLRLGVSLRAALAATLLLGGCSYVAVQATTFFQHSAEALFLLLAVYFLSADSRQPSARLRAAAGAAAGLLLLFRFQGAVALPALFLFLVATAARRAPRESSRVRRAAAEAIPFLLPVAAALLAHLMLNKAKFGRLSLTGAYGEQTSWFHNPILKGLFGLLASPSEGLLLFCPLLLLLPWTMRFFFRRHAPEAALVAGLALSYLVLIAKYDLWHGQWCFGPRYLTPIVPLLLLPLGGWIEAGEGRRWRAVAPFAAFGAWVALLGLAVNFSYVYYVEGYFREQPRYPFLFIVGRSQLLAHARALFAMDARVDVWLLNILRGHGFGAFLLAAVPAVLLLALAAGGLRRGIAEARTDPAALGAERVLPRARSLVLGAGVVALATLVGMAAGGRTSPEDEQARLMSEGMDALYQKHAPEEAIADFRKVLEMNAGHYGATFQLARAYDAAGRPAEARPLWIRMFTMAANDPPTLATVRERLSRPDSEETAESLMKTGMDLLYVKHDPGGAEEKFRKVLQANPEHYGANYQIGVALDELGQAEPAREYWKKVLRMAEGYRDAPTLATAKKRLGVP